MNFHQDIPYSNLVITALQIYRREVTQRIIEGSLCLKCLNLIYIALKFNHDISKGYLVMGCTRRLIEGTRLQNKVNGSNPSCKRTLSLPNLYIAIFKVHYYIPKP